MPRDKAKIFLLDDHEVIRAGLALFINRQEDMLVCGEAHSAKEALAKIEKNPPDLVIVDLQLHESSGLELISNLRHRQTGPVCLVFSSQADRHSAETAFSAGAAGYLLKSEPLPKVLEFIRRALTGQLVVSDEIASSLLSRQFGRSPENPVTTLLSEREQQVFAMIADWKGTKEIANHLHLSSKTVEYYRENIKKKLKIRSGTELVKYATSWAATARTGHTAS
jgi:DNA-binding NarL/FixJ family response regulator